MGYDFEIKFRPRTTNEATNALSQHPNLAQMQLGALVTLGSVDWGLLKEEISKDPYLSKLLGESIIQGGALADFTLTHGCLLHKGCTVIPKKLHYDPKTVT